MPKQVITIGHGGVMSGLQVKPGKGVDLRQFGDASIKRASDIEWDETAQAWTVRLMSTKDNGMRITYRMFEERVGHSACNMGYALPDAGVKDQPVRSAEYEDAVTIEIAYLNAVRLQDGSNACN